MCDEPFQKGSTKRIALITPGVKEQNRGAVACGALELFGEHSELIEGADGNLYGTTVGGGTGYPAKGTVFKITPEGDLTTLHNFSGVRDANGGTVLSF
jgi:uncharacterized repeat protein (TIGR03803 family)